MRRSIALIGVSIALGAHGCAGDDETPPGPGPQNDAAADAPSADPEGCARIGGECSCAGSCPRGFEPAGGPSLLACAQPCEGCGACSMHCCVPEGDAGCTGSFACLCGDAICVDGEWTCGPCPVSHDAAQ